MPGGESKRRCGGPPDVTYFPYEGIYLEVSINRSAHYPFFGVDFRVPEGVTAQLKSEWAELVQGPPDNPVRTQIKLVPIDIGRHTLKNAVQPMVGRTTKRKYLFREEDSHEWFPLTAEQELFRVKGETGVLVLPDLYVNGTLRSGPRIPFQKSHAFGIVPLNGC